MTIIYMTNILMTMANILITILPFRSHGTQSSQLQTFYTNNLIMILKISTKSILYSKVFFNTHKT